MKDFFGKSRSEQELRDYSEERKMEEEGINADNKRNIEEKSQASGSRDGDSQASDNESGEIITGMIIDKEDEMNRRKTNGGMR